jgi:hypothetical protein
MRIIKLTWAGFRFHDVEIQDVDIGEQIWTIFMKLDVLQLPRLNDMCRHQKIRDCLQRMLRGSVLSLFLGIVLGQRFSHDLKRFVIFSNCARFRGHPFPTLFSWSAKSEFPACTRRWLRTCSSTQSQRDTQSTASCKEAPTSYIEGMEISQESPAVP